MIKKRFHHILDMTNCNEKILNKDVIEKFIKKMAQVLDMQIIKGPIMADGVEANPGLSAFAIVDFSHISIHSFTNMEIFIDIFSCKTYDKNLVIQLCNDYFATPQSKIRHEEVWWG